MRISPETCKDFGGYVLILVVMEYTQWVNKKKYEWVENKVLILVVMEYTQWDAIFPVINPTSLNPCCNGIYSMRKNNYTDVRSIVS